MMGKSKLKNLAYKLQDAIAIDRELEKPSYVWCREQIVKQETFARNDWHGFVDACKAVARRAG